MLNLSELDSCLSVIYCYVTCKRYFCSSIIYFNSYCISVSLLVLLVCIDDDEEDIEDDLDDEDHDVAYDEEEDDRDDELGMLNLTLCIK